jgi:hypothetical protein
MKFTGLRRTDLTVAEENDRAERLFPILVGESRLHLWNPGDSVAPGRRLLVGAVTWSIYDLSLLDVLDDALAMGGGAVSRVDVFDLDRAGRDALEVDIPGLGNIATPPVAGLWEDGVLREKGWGWGAISLISAVFGIRLAWKDSGWLVGRVQENDPR